MRSYPTNSPQAQARIVLLALLADGVINMSEMSWLQKQQILQRIDIDQQGFERIIREFSEDLQEHAWLEGADHVQVDRQILDPLLEEIVQPFIQKKVLRLILEIVDADGRVDGGEAVLLTHAIDAWHIDLFEVSVRTPPLSRSAARAI